MRKSISCMVLMSVFLLLSTGLSVAQSKKYILKTGDVYPKNSGYHELVKEYFIPTIEWRSKGQIEVQYFPFGQLGSETEMLNKVREGIMQGMTLSGSVTADLIPKHQILNIPFLFRSWEEMRKFTYSPEASHLMADELWAPLGLKAIAFHHYSYFNIATATKMVKSLEDIRGIKFRLPPSGSFRDHYAAWGLSPITIPFGEIYSALKQGVMDGLPHTDMIIHDLKLYEVIRYITRTESLVGWQNALYNKKWFDSLPENLRYLITDVTTKLHMQAAISHEKLDYNAQIIFLKRGSPQIITLSTEEKKKFIEASKPVYMKVKKIAGEEYVNSVEKLLGHGYGL